MKANVGDTLKNAHTGVERKVKRDYGYAIQFEPLDGQPFNSIHDEWTAEDINIHWQNITQNEPEKKFGPYGFNPNVTIGSGGLQYRYGHGMMDETYVLTNERTDELVEPVISKDEVINYQKHRATCEKNRLKRKSKRRSR